MSRFAPWRRDYVGGALLIACGAGALAWAAQAPLRRLGALAAGAVLIALAARLLRRARVRRGGKAIERDAIGSLGSLPYGWTAEANLRLPYGGDLDLYLQAPDGTGYAVEIKAHRDLMVERRFFGLRRRLLAVNGRPLARDPLPQTLRNAQHLDAVPVLWLPRAEGATERVGGVLLVRGDAQRLRRAVGMRRWWPWW